jgi:hypothetical protein
MKYSKLTEDVALLLYTLGARGRSPTDYQWAECGDWYREMARKVILAIEQDIRDDHHTFSIRKTERVPFAFREE